jgi:hypothetical protein
LNFDDDGGPAASEALKQPHLPAVLLADELLHVDVVDNPGASFEPGAALAPAEVDFATNTRGSRRMRFTFQVVAPVQTSSLRPSSLATHTGVETSVPSRLRVVRLMYRVPARPASEVYIVY